MSPSNPMFCPVEMSQVSPLDPEGHSPRMRPQAGYIKEALGGNVTGLNVFLEKPVTSSMTSSVGVED